MPLDGFNNEIYLLHKPIWGPNTQTYITIATWIGQQEVKTA